MQSNGDIRIDGVLKGNLIAKAKILIGADGVVEGDIDGKQADILGKVSGKIKVADLLYLHGKAVVDGDIYAGKLQIEPTAAFNGQCHMGANVVELITERANVVNE
jgi:cytoskeletal protein CcmA (bactofilin family)